MRKVLAVITALVLAAFVFAPAMGYTISPQGKINYTINSEKVNYTIGSGIPAHETVYSEEMAEHYPTYSIGSTPMPYSIKLGTIAKYSIKPETNAAKIVALGGYRSSVLGTTEKVGNGLKLQKEPENKTEQVSAPPVIPAVPNATNTTKPEKPANVTVPAPVVVKFSIMGKVTDDNQTGLADVKVNLEQPAKTIIANTTTSKDGSYSLADLMPGDYVVAEVLPANWTAVTPADGMASVTLKDKDMTVDFVNKMMPVLAPAPATPSGNETNITAPNTTASNTTEPIK